MIVAMLQRLDILTKEGQRERNGREGGGSRAASRAHGAHAVRLPSSYACECAGRVHSVVRRQTSVVEWGSKQALGSSREALRRSCTCIICRMLVALSLTAKHLPAAWPMACGGADVWTETGPEARGDEGVRR